MKSGSPFGNGGANGSAVLRHQLLPHRESEPQLAEPGDWLERVGLLRPNASAKDKAELCQIGHLERGDPVDLAGRMGSLEERMPNVIVWDGSCGTWDKHLELIGVQSVCLRFLRRPFDRGSERYANVRNRSKADIAASGWIGWKTDLNLQCSELVESRPRRSPAESSAHNEPKCNVCLTFKYLRLPQGEHRF